jgi:hypothetical protein
VDDRVSMLGVGAALGLALVLAIGVLVPRGGSVPVGAVFPSAVPSRGSPRASLPPRVPAMAVEELYARFARGGPAVAGTAAVDLSTERAGELFLQTGRVVASDAFYLTFDPPFTRWLPPGRHSVFVLHAATAKPHDDRIAAALIRAAPGDPVRWEMALHPGQNLATLDPDEFYGYGVDSGTGSFASAEAAEWLSRAGDAALEAYSGRVEAAMFPSRNEIHPVVDVPLGDPSGLNVIAFSSGWGDGSYPSYFGLDADGRPLVLLTDFQILDR